MNEGRMAEGGNSRGNYGTGKTRESKADEKAFSLNEIIEGMLILLQSTG